MQEVITSIEDLKSVAKKYGYNLIKSQKAEPFLPCTCGCKRRTLYFICKPGLRNGKRLECKQCGSFVEGESSKIRKLWNDMIRKKQGEEIDENL